MEPDKELRYDRDWCMAYLLMVEHQTPGLIFSIELLDLFTKVMDNKGGQ